MLDNKLQRIFVIRPVEVRLYTYFGERVRYIPENYTVDEEMTMSEAMNTLRAYRNDLLLRCDWTQLADSPISAEQKEQWKSYRQALRDFPQYVDKTLWTAPAWPLAPGESEKINDEFIFDYPPQRQPVELNNNNNNESIITNPIEEIIDVTPIESISETIENTVVTEETQLSSEPQVIFKNTVPQIVSYQTIDGEEKGMFDIFTQSYPSTPENIQQDNLPPNES
jgi:hypothetical protein